jgi:hypothetical protein
MCAFEYTSSWHPEHAAAVGVMRENSALLLSAEVG